MTRIAIAATMTLALTAFGQDARSGLVVHEWGTFTAVYGADGAMMEWRPLVGDDLPDFVYDRATVVPRVVGKGKEEYVTYERMETPVLYFYTDRETPIDVTVRFPKGLITEWYPFIYDLKPALGNAAPEVRDGSVRWFGTVIPNASAKLPSHGESNHYYHARETDAAVVRVKDSRREE